MLFLSVQNQSVIAEETPLSLLQEENKKLTEINTEFQQKIAFLEHELAQLKRMIFGSKRERYVPADNGQLSLDLDAELIAELQQEEEQVSYTRKKAKKKGKAVRLELPAHLPRQTEVIEPENKREGAKKIGEAVTEILEYNPGKIYVRRIVRPKYVQPIPETGVETDQDAQIIIAPLPILPIPQGNSGASLLAYLSISKFIDHLPFYRIVQMFKREGITLAESTINGWFIAMCRLLEPLYEELKKVVQNADYLFGDETPMPVKSSHKKGALHKGYFWVYRAPKLLAVFFDYHKGRGNKCPKEFLQCFQGALQTDGYAAYEQFESNPLIILLACMAHARRYFEKALDNDAQKAGYMMSKIQDLYKIERDAKEKKLTYQERFDLRQKKAVPILNEIEIWLKANIGNVLPKSAIGTAIAYSLKLWPRLRRYTDNGEWEIDNNLVENSIRSVALGRKNYLFAGSHESARYAAMMYSFFGTCKMNDINPLEWFTETLTKIPECKLNDLKKLLPIKQ